MAAAAQLEKGMMQEQIVHVREKPLRNGLWNSSDKASLLVDPRELLVPMDHDDGDPGEAAALELFIQEAPRRCREDEISSTAWKAVFGCAAAKRISVESTARAQGLF